MPSPDPRVTLSTPSRRRVFDLVAAHESGATAHRLAEITGLHVTTVRHHLAALEEGGLVTATPISRPVPGRPEHRFVAVPSATDRPDTGAESGSYRRLTAALLGRWGDDPGPASARAERAGDDWAARELSPRPQAEPRSLPDAARDASAVFADLGFDPRVADRGTDGVEMALHACPYAQVVAERPDVVCSVHLGLLRGLIGRLGRPGGDVAVGPWATPGRCVAVLTPPTDARPPGGGQSGTAAPDSASTSDR